MASEDRRFLVQDCTETSGVDTASTLLLEPVARNTATAMAWAALNAKPQYQLLFLRADHHITNAQALADTVRSGAAAAATGAIVTFGVQPTFPSTAYGYILQGEPLGRDPHARSVRRFIEKP